MTKRKIISFNHFLFYSLSNFGFLKYPIISKSSGVGFSTQAFTISFKR